MSGIANGMTKVFSTLGSGVARIGRSITGVGAATVTAGAATAAPPLAQGGLSGFIQQFTGGGVLGNVLTGAITTAGYGALISAVTGGDPLKGAMWGGLAGGIGGAAGINLDPTSRNFLRGPNAPGATQNAVPAGDTQSMMPAEGVVAANSPSGVAPTGQTGGTGGALSDQDFNRRWQTFDPMTPSMPITQPTAPGTAPTTAAPAPAQTSSGGFGQFTNPTLAAGLLSGVGQGLAAAMTAKEARRAREEEQRFEREKEERLRSSYTVTDASLFRGGVSSDTGRPAPAQKWGRQRKRYEYVPGQGVQEVVR